VCDLLEASPTFNNSNVLIGLVIQYCTNDSDKISSRCQLCLCDLLKQDTGLSLASEIVKSVASVAGVTKGCIKVGAALLDLLLNVPFEEAELASQRETFATRGNNRQRVGADVEKDIRLSSVHPDVKDVRKREGTILRDLFIIFLRVLRAPHLHPVEVVSSTLRGLGRFAHRVNVDMLVEIVEELRLFLRPLCKGGDHLQYGEEIHRGWVPPPFVALLAVKTALQLTENFASSLMVDMAWTFSAVCGIMRSSLSFLQGCQDPLPADDSKTVALKCEEPALHDWESLIDDSPIECWEDRTDEFSTDFVDELMTCIESLIKSPVLLGVSAAEVHAVGNWSSLLEVIYDISSVAIHTDQVVAKIIWDKLTRIMARFPRLCSVLEPDGAIVSSVSQEVSAFWQYELMRCHSSPELRKQSGHSR